MSSLTVRADKARRLVGRLDLTAWFLLLGGVFGAVLVFFIPPSQGLDEPNHFFRVYSITQGKLVAPITNGRASVVVPPCTYAYVNDLYLTTLKPVSYHVSDLWRSPSGCAHHPGQLVPIENTAVNSPVSYVPQALTVFLLRAAGAPIAVVFFGGRLAGLAVYLALIYAAIRVAPRGKAVFFIVGLMPTALGLASSYSADGMSIALALLATALALRLCLDEEVDRRWFLALAATLTVLAVTKNTYFVLAPLVLIVPSRVFGGSRRLATTAKAAALGAAALVTAAWYLAVRHVSLAAYAPPGHVIDPHAQISFIVHHPLGYTKVLARTIFDNGPESYFVPGFVQAMGFFRTVSRGSANAPLGLVILATILLFSAYRAEVGRPRPGVSTLTYARALLPLALAAVAVVVIFSVLWWQWTAVGSLTVREIQGRYFLPLMGLPVLTVALLRTKPIGLSRWRWLVIGSLVMLAYTALKVWVLFY